MAVNKPLVWVANPHAPTVTHSAAAARLMPPGTTRETLAFHRAVPDYEVTPLKSLNRLAAMLGVGSIWVKDEATRMGLNSFKSLGGSYAIYRWICEQLGVARLSYGELVSAETRSRLGDVTFCSATDGNHGKGLAWACRRLGFPCIIYVHRDTTRPRIDAIAELGAEVRVVMGNYDDAVRQCSADAAANGWQVISDTSWDGYEALPQWVMQGYATLVEEAQRQLAVYGLDKPTHVFVQAGVGAFAAAVVSYYQQQFGAERPVTVIVEPANAACLYESARAGDGLPRTVYGDLQTIMAGLACGEPSPLAWRALWECADVFVAAPDYVAAKGMRVYGVPLRGDPVVIAGESGAVTLGALMFAMEGNDSAELRHHLQLGPDSHVLLINTEGNTDPEYFRRVVWEGIHAVPKAFRYVKPTAG